MMTTFMRAGFGVSARPASRRPPLLFELYEFEGCPYCRLVREALTELDLDALILPCPKGGGRFRPKAVALGGKAQFPYFVDPNASRQMYESGDIVLYLYETYAGTRPPLHWQLIELQKFGSALAGMPRLSAGVRARASVAPAEPLELFSFEASPYARPVRERLCELEIPFVLRSVGRTSMSDWIPPVVRTALSLRAQPTTVNRRALIARANNISIPYLIDPNTDVELGESADILAYLDDTYAR